MALPKCPVCKKRDKVTMNGDLHYCGRCRGLFDSDPNEGGTAYSDPTKRLREAEKNKRDRSHLKGGL